MPAWASRMPTADRLDLAIQNTKQAFERRERTSEPEKLYISTHYYDIVTGEADKAIEAYQLWKRTYPRDSIPTNNLASSYAAVGKFDQALVEAQETMRLAPNEALSFQNVGGDYLGLNRFAEAKAVREKQVAANLDAVLDHADLYVIAYFEGDTAAMQRQVDWAKGKPDEYDMLQVVADAQASAGKLRQARETYSQAIEVARRGKVDEIVARTTVLHAWTEALMGNTAEARSQAMAAMAVSRNRPTLVLSGIVLALAGDVSGATAIADELGKTNPTHTYINNIYLPMIRAEIEINRGNPAKAIELLKVVSPYEFGWASRAWPNYVRGTAYLKARNTTFRPGSGRTRRRRRARPDLAEALHLGQHERAGRARQGRRDASPMWKHSGMPLACDRPPRTGPSSGCCSGCPRRRRPCRA